MRLPERADQRPAPASVPRHRRLNRANPTRATTRNDSHQKIAARESEGANRQFDAWPLEFRAQATAPLRALNGTIVNNPSAVAR